MECPHSVVRDEHGKLLYDVQLRAPKERRRRVQSFAGAIAESYGSGSFSASKSPRARYRRSGDAQSSLGDEGSHHSSSF